MFNQFFNEVKALYEYLLALKAPVKSMTVVIQHRNQILEYKRVEVVDNTLVIYTKE